ncbi:MAG: MltA domain-containing protein [Bacteriovoracaceae bacterium]|nr:MltA domain-containing protein [Bacteriovoracaceae bacterium]
MKTLLIFVSLIIANLAVAEVTPTQRLFQSLSFVDDLSLENLDLAIERQLQSYANRRLTGTIKFGSKEYPKTVLKDSLILLRTLAGQTRQCLKSNPQAVCLNAFNQEVNAKFAIYVPLPAKKEPGFRSKATTKFTSYYSPDLHGSRVPTERFKRPIYRKPDQPSEQNYTRVDIDYRGALAGKGYEIFWVEESFFDLYLLHVQGGGRINIFNADGSKEVKYLSYDGKNERSFQMIYKYMMAKGYLQPNNAGIPGQRQFLIENPHKEEEIFGSCPSYVYFKESDEEPVGLDNIPLTEGRSLAIDSRIYKTMGMINFVKTVKASHVDADGKVVKVPFSRFFIAQDTGGAIRGNARCDLYFGYGPLAELTAYNMNEQGEQYFLIKK